MRSRTFTTVQIWAFREVLRQPFESFLVAATLALTIATTGTLLLFPRAMVDTLKILLKNTPAIIVRQVDATGWRPIPAEPSVRAAAGVIGVVSAKPRVWGVVQGPAGPLTVLGVQPGMTDLPFEQDWDSLPKKGEAVIGPGLSTDIPENTLVLKGTHQASYRVTGQLSKETGLFANDLVLLSMEDARQLIGLPKGYASDLAIEVYHEEEQEAILPDLAAAFDMLVTLTTRQESTGRYTAAASRGRTLWAIALIPAVLAVCILVAVNIRRSMGLQAHVGVMKAVGWTTGDIVRLQLYRQLFICLPSAAVGACAAFLLVYRPGAHWLSGFLLGWEGTPPRLYLDPNGALIVIFEVIGMVLAPVIVSALLQSLKVSTGEAHDLIEGTG